MDFLTLKPHFIVTKGATCFHCTLCGFIKQIYFQRVSPISIEQGGILQNLGALGGCHCYDHVTMNLSPPTKCTCFFQPYILNGVIVVCQCYQKGG